jgi:hypothetical protein
MGDAPFHPTAGGQVTIHIHWQHILGFMLVVVPVSAWTHKEYQIHICGQRTIIEVCK